MKLYMGGVRGGNVVTDPEFLRYGGDTTSLLIEGTGGERIIVDAGSGLRNVYDRLIKSEQAHQSVLFLFSHFHLDHLMGLPNFPAWFNSEWSIEMAARVFDELTVEDIVESFVNPPLWPLSLDEMQATSKFRILDDESREQPSVYGSLEIRWCPLHHPGGSTAFRVDEPSTGKSVVIASDVEWGESTEEERGWLELLCRTPRPASVLVFDGTYDAESYEQRRGWGHSTWQEGVALAQACDVGQLYITHHDPSMQDDACAAKEAELRIRCSQASMARQGVLIDV